MKKLIALLVIVIVANVAYAQEFKQACKKDSFVMSDGLIQATLYHDNGAIAQKGYYTTQNELHGEWISYDVAGNITAVAQYDHGNKVGTWYFYQGNIKKEVTYVDSRISEVKTWENTDTRIVTN